MLKYSEGIVIPDGYFSISSIYPCEPRNGGGRTPTLTINN